MISPIRRPRSQEMQRPRQPHEAGQEERRAGLGRDAEAREREADARGAPGEAGRTGEGEGDAEAGGGAVDGCEGGFGVLVDGSGDEAASVQEVG